MNEQNKYNAVLPFFSGFYYSTLDAMIDREMEMEIEGCPPERAPKTWEEVNEYANYPAAMIAIAKGWVRSFSAETGLEMEWEYMQSPREYNFTTDRVFANLPQTTLDKLSEVRESDEFAAVLEDMFTSHDGFIPYYPNKPDAGVWLKPVEEWDHNQLQALIRAYVIKEVNADEHNLRQSVEDRPCVYEAAQALWDPIPREPQFVKITE